MQRVKEARSNPVFPLIQIHLKEKGLPKTSLEELDCIENIEYALLCLPDENFDYLAKENKEEVKIDKKGTVKTGNKDIDELEKIFSEGGDIDGYFKQLEQSIKSGD